MTYATSGVDIDAGERLVELIQSAVRRTHSDRVMGRHGDFAGMFRLDYDTRLFKHNYRDPVLVACTDGVGTKVKVAAEMARYDTIGIDCVAMNVNDLVVQGAEPLFFLDYLGLHRQDPERTAEIIGGVARGCWTAGCALIGGECAEMPDLYAEGDFDIAGFAVGVVQLKRVVDPTRVEAGDVVIGLASSGVHANGYSLVRQIVREGNLDLDRAEPALREPSGETPTLGEVLLRPTRIYAKSIVRLLARYRVKRIVSGMAHVTGGGLAGNLSRALPDDLDAVIDDTTWTAPPIFSFLQEHGGVEDDEMRRVFNLGVGYVLVVRPPFADSVVRQMKRFGEHPFIMGVITRGSGAVRLQ